MILHMRRAVYAVTRTTWTWSQRIQSEIARKDVSFHKRQRQDETEEGDLLHNLIKAFVTSAQQRLRGTSYLRCPVSVD